MDTKNAKQVREEISRYTTANELQLTPDAVLAMAGALQLDEIKGLALTSPSMTVNYLTTMLKSEKHECFMGIFLDTRHRVIKAEVLFRGTIDGATVYPRVIAEKALLCSAAAIIVAHNHPSGVTEPSLADQAITRRIKDALLLLDIRLLDHFVIGDGVPTSMASRGML